MHGWTLKFLNLKVEIFYFSTAVLIWGKDTNGFQSTLTRHW